ncbi:MAG TPA: hypothetical protein VKZ63_15255 [Kofleriaceae bacterium]|nr:hypothetical protein [Kofleriaceae bacterium]
MVEGDSQVTGVAFHQGLLLAAFDDGVVRIWDAATGRALSRLRGHQGGVYRMQLRPDGRQLATAALDPVPRLWRLPHRGGSPAEVAERARCGGAWRLEGGMPVPPSADALRGCARP